MSNETYKLNSYNNTTSQYEDVFINEDTKILTGDGACKTLSEWQEFLTEEREENVSYEATIEYLENLDTGCQTEDHSFYAK